VLACTPHTTASSSSSECGILCGQFRDQRLDAAAVVPPQRRLTLARRLLARARSNGSRARDHRRRHSGGGVTCDGRHGQHRRAGRCQLPAAGGAAGDTQQHARVRVVLRVLLARRRRQHGAVCVVGLHQLLLLLLLLLCMVWVLLRGCGLQLLLQLADGGLQVRHLLQQAAAGRHVTVAAAQHTTHGSRTGTTAPKHSPSAAWLAGCDARTHARACTHAHTRTYTHTPVRATLPPPPSGASGAGTETPASWRRQRGMTRQRHRRPQQLRKLLGQWWEALSCWVGEWMGGFAVQTDRRFWKSNIVRVSCQH
jgi:hypothetical protein